MADSNERILSIQSHVVSGYVGNKSASFPLQLLGFEVDTINSVQFSNHTGYPKGIKGQILNDEQLWELIQGLQENKIDCYSHLINGYIGNPKFLTKLADVVKTLKQRNPKLIYVCDPVMGDFGPGMYVDSSLLPIYKQEILEIADICIPNQFEAELLTDMKINNLQEALKAMNKIHEKGVQTVIFSSTELVQDHLLALASTNDSSKRKKTVYSIEIPKLPASFVGTGDLFTALCTAWLHKSNGDLKVMLEKTVATMQCVLKLTLSHGEAQKVKLGQAKILPHQLELKLIQSKADIENPDIKIRAKEVQIK